MADQFERFQKLGVGVIAVGMSRPEGVARYLAERPLPFPLMADPERKGYAAFELGRTSLLRWLRPGIVWRFLKSIVRGGKVRRVAEGEDPMQTGGDFLISEGRLQWAHTTPDPTSRPSVDMLLAAVRQCRTTVSGPKSS